jgi:hypothetical protein
MRKSGIGVFSVADLDPNPGSGSFLTMVGKVTSFVNG